MAVRLTDGEIQALIDERKPMPDGLAGTRRPKPRPGRSESDHAVVSHAGNVFQVRVRQSTRNPFDFSVILLHQPHGLSEWFRLRRHNGNSHDHSNRIEGSLVTGFHRHTATERYQERGFREDGYVEPVATYADVNGAIAALLDECGFEQAPTSQPGLFDQEAP
jgi:hypothetical protein